MFGAMIGDIVGSRWEFRRIKTKAFPLFSELNVITDDSILTVAVADALMNDLDPAVAMRDWARRVKKGQYGKRFIRWVAAPTVQPAYGSFGNGGAMRVSPAALLADSLDAALKMARGASQCGPGHCNRPGQFGDLPVPAQGASVHARVSDHARSGTHLR